MLGNLFRPRPSTVSPSPAFQTQPTASQLTDAKTPSKFIKKLKELKRALRPSRRNNKDGDHAGDKSNKTHRSQPSDESFGNLAPGPFTAQDYEFRRPAPIINHLDFGPNATFIDGPLGTGAPSNTPSNLPVDASSPPLSPTPEALVNAAHRLQQSPPTSQVEAEVLAIRRRIGESGALESDVRRDEARETPAIRSRHAQAFVPHLKENVEPVVEHVCSLKRGRANQRRQRPQKLLVQELLNFCQGDVERAPLSTVTNLPEFHDQKRNSNLAEAPQAPTQPLEGFMDEGSAPRESAVRQPLGLFNQNPRLSGADQASPQAGAIEDSEDMESFSQDHAVRAWTPDPSLWYGQMVFPLRKNSGPSQL
ncbi:hypothetical protein M407DRAFT_31768 [Tulasnella calospora MUT 4182]|uniref:Uncharacterized protein n=1 Tax=Tulasnella calospora MUT 4182 TaxID=1051891 RepID=A0A0C3PUM9_9AGAM|nr:hypothetical protein M407DRAFT_31768 [Tulasnella calospora MUT 4182]